MELKEILQSFRPVVIGDPIGLCAGDRIVSLWWFVLLGLVLGGLVLAILRRKFRCRLWISVASGGLIALLCYGIGYGLQVYCGGPYNYDGYVVPNEACDVLIWFSGADEGAYGYDKFLLSDVHKVNAEFGEGRAAMFNFLDIDRALEFVEKLPDGCRIVVRGHSMGGTAAFRFAERCKKEICVLDTRDPTSWFGRPTGKPAMVCHWRTVLPGDTGFKTKYPHPYTAEMGSWNASNVYAWIGGSWGEVPGATVIRLENADHTDVSLNID